MSNKINDGDFSADELIRRLKENLEMEASAPDIGGFELPEEPSFDSAPAESAEEIIRRSLRDTVEETAEEIEETAEEKSTSTTVRGARRG